MHASLSMYMISRAILSATLQHKMCFAAFCLLGCEDVGRLLAHRVPFVTRFYITNMGNSASSRCLSVKLIVYCQSGMYLRTRLQHLGELQSQSETVNIGQKAGCVAENQM